jgi:CelD/BcsL family acetyltransferase involved in cellulose biosynthesis
MKSNPFLSNTFTTVWLKHFNKGKPGESFPFFGDLRFVKHKRWPLYANVGKTHTKGISYAASPDSGKTVENKVFLIYDVPTYFKLDGFIDDRLKVIKTKQYPGFLVNLNPFTSIDAYLNAVFNRKSRYKIRSYKKTLEESFSISYKMFYGTISKKDYDTLFEYFRLLLERRFTEKQVSNNNLEASEWAFYSEVVYAMVLEKRASIFVVYDEQKPIGIMLNFMADATMFVAITVFDVSYSKYNVGTVNILKLMEWAIENKIEKVDFSKGYYDYKKRWGSIPYDFEYHIVYDRKSVQARTVAFSVYYFFQLKQYLRQVGANNLLHKVTYIIKRKPISETV